MSTTEPIPTPEMLPTGRMPNLEAQLITQAIQDPAFRQRLIENPKAVLAEHGLNVPDDVQINVLQESSTQYYLVLPTLEVSVDSQEAVALSDEELEAVAGGGSLNSQNANWTGCASGQSGCVATNACNVAVLIASAVGIVGATAAGIATGGAGAVVGIPLTAAACGIAGGVPASMK